ncbi:YcnI family protein [Fodinicola acaciae]|uniref:YcnI family copper-binding membrane protein n=1 Tax=Fodinicola acaciae TaxID=2681555 RepID=UPI0013D78845|nr:YcnI family protein [Fodinicola acaciae]
MTFPHRTVRRTGALALAAGIGVAASLAIAAPAAAHVHVYPDATAAGSYAKLTFRVPNEEDGADTTKIVITVPTDHPLRSVRTKPHAGWTATTTTVNLPKAVNVGDATITKAVNSITFTAAAGQGIKPGEFDEFDVSVGPLPEGAKQLVFPTAQYYSDNKVVNWNQPTPANGQEPENPAPAFALTAKTADHDMAASEPTPTATASSDGLARGLGVAGLVFGLLGIGVAGWAVLRRPSGAKSS